MIYRSIIPNSLYCLKTKGNVMNNKNMVLIVSLITIVGTINSSLVTVSAHTPNTLPYGEIGQEDELYFWHDDVLYINAVPSIGNGLFIAETDIDKDYSIDQAIQRFHIDEDITAFNVKPSLYSNAIVLYELDENLQFQLVDIYEDSESGLTQEVQQYF